MKNFPKSQLFSSKPLGLKFRWLIRCALLAAFLGASPAAFPSQDTLPPLKDGNVPNTLDKLWNGYDPRKEPLNVEVLKEWEQDGIICRVIRYDVGVFKGATSKVAAFYGFPKGGANLPALLEIHGGGQAANLDFVIAAAKHGYACISINWGGNKLNFGRTQVSYDGPNTDWGKVDCTHPPQRNKVNHFAGGIAPDEYTLDSVESPRNNNCFLVLIAFRRAITFLEQQKEVDPSKIGVYGHSMGGKFTTDLAGIDKRVKAAVPSCGGAGDVAKGETDLPGLSKRKQSALELACVSSNAYIPRISCPILYVGPTNDFAGPIDNMFYVWRNLGSREVRYAITPHMNHMHESTFLMSGLILWFEQHLKGELTMPATPKLDLNLKTSDGIPLATVMPDMSMPVREVNIYYSIDPNILTRFWRSATAVRQGNQWTAACPILSLDQPLFVLANVIYELPEKYRKADQLPYMEHTDVFGLTSEMRVASDRTLKEAGVKATDTWSPMIDNGACGLRDWYRLGWGYPSIWQISTRKLKDPKWRGPDGAKLAFETRCETDNTLVITITCNGWGAVLPGKPQGWYTVVRQFKGSPEWQKVSVSLDEFEPTKPNLPPELKRWANVTELSFSPSGTTMKDGKAERINGKVWKGERQMRNLRWEGGTCADEQVKAAPAVSQEALQRGFNDAIKKSLQDEKREATGR